MQDESAQGPDRIAETGAPRIELVPKTPITARRLGVFAASFNPVTNAHIELMNKARDRFSLDQVLAIISQANADKSSYECSIEDRLSMISLAIGQDMRTLIGISSHPFFADMIDALDSLCPEVADLFFILGFDTFERVLDRKRKYFKKYHRRFASPSEALAFLLSRSHLLVAGRGGSGRLALQKMIENLPIPASDHIQYLDLPGEFADVSATRVRALISTGADFSEMVPLSVQQYIIESGLYRKDG